jgi:hypothetical protein
MTIFTVAFQALNATPHTVRGMLAQVTFREEFGELRLRLLLHL